MPLYDEAVPAYTMFYDEWVSNPLPPMFSCHNDDLSDMLTPIYERSNTWREFFQELYKMYDRKTCAVVHSWYLDIYGKLAKVPITTDWKIDLTTRPTIPFEITSKNNSIRPMNIKMGTLCPFLIDSSALRPCESYKLGLFSDYGPSAHNTKMPDLNVHRSQAHKSCIISPSARKATCSVAFVLRRFSFTVFTTSRLTSWASARVR